MNFYLCADSPTKNLARVETGIYILVLAHFQYRFLKNCNGLLSLSSLYYCTRTLCNVQLFETAGIIYGEGKYSQYECLTCQLYVLWLNETP